MPGITILEKDYLDKAYACWMGKCIGGTLGRPLEGKRGPHRLTFYRPIPHRASENDELDIQLVWMHALRERGVELTSGDLASEWRDHVIYWFDEFRFARSNFGKGVVPPISGWFNNWFKGACRGAVRSEIWALIAPGSPAIAAEYAYRDASIDHTDEGVYGAMFLAAIQSAAFVTSDVKKLLKIGLSIIPENCRISRAVQDVIGWHKKMPLLDARRMLLEGYGSNNFSDAPQNVGIVVLGWLYGEGDFERGMLATVNCGLDSACNSGAIGSIIGIVGGRDGIPVNWQAPIKGRIAPGRGIVGFDPPHDIEVLAQRSLELARVVLEKRDTSVKLPATKPKGYRKTVPGDFGDGLSPMELTDGDRLSEEHRLGAATLRIQYNGYPTVGYDKPTEIDLIVSNTSEKAIEGHIDFTVPWGWRVEPQDGLHFAIKKKGKPAAMKLALSAVEGEVQLLPVNPVSAHVGIKGQQPVTVEFSLLGERRWLVAGPYGKKGDRAYERVYLPEKAIAERKPSGKVVFEKASFPEFLMDVNPFFGQKKEGVIYAFGWFHSSRKRDLRMFASCNDGIKVWLNDRIVLARHNHRPIRPPEYRSDIQVQRGWNRLLLKIARCGDPVHLHFYFGDRKNHVFDDLIDTYLPPEVLAFAE
jgi:hypothetical protein